MNKDELPLPSGLQIPSTLSVAGPDSLAVNMPPPSQRFSDLPIVEPSGSSNVSGLSTVASIASAMAAHKISAITGATFGLQATIQKFSEGLSASSQLAALGVNINLSLSQQIASISAVASPACTVVRDAFAGLSTVMDASTRLKDSLIISTSAQRTLLDSIGDINASMRSMSLILEPLQSSSIAMALKMDGTLKSLSLAADISVLTSRLDQGELTSMAVRSRLEALTISQQIMPAYLSAASSVFSVERRLSELQSGERNMLGLVSNLSRTIADLQGSLSVLAVGAREFSRGVGGWSDLVRADDIAWLRRPAVELYTASKTTAVISSFDKVELDVELEETLDQELDAFPARIGELDANLPVLYHGGIEAMERGGKDWQRHAMTSFRELATHVLHLLAPDNAVIAIATPSEIVNGRPTRALRFRYIFGDAKNGAVSKFYQADMKAAVELFEVLNRGTHELGNCATPVQVRYLRSRLVGLVTSMLDANQQQ